MNLFDSNHCVKYFAGLYPSMTDQQALALRDGVMALEASLAEFETAARAVAISKPYINDAIPALMERLNRPKPFTAPPRVMTWVDEANEASRRERESVAEQHARDDELIRITPADRVDGLMHEVIMAQEEPVRSIWRKKGIGSRAVRCAVAARLRAGELKHQEAK